MCKLFLFLLKNESSPVPNSELKKLVDNSILNLLKNSTQIEILFGKSYFNNELLNKTTKDKLSFINN